MRSEVCQTLSTSEVPRCARLERWNEFGSETLASLVVDPVDRETFDARISRRVVGGLGFTWMELTCATARYGGGRVGAWAAPNNDAFLLKIQERGRCRTEQKGRASIIGCGDLMLLDASQPFVTEMIEPMSVVTVKLPIERLLTRIADPEAVAGLTLKADRGYGALASSILLAIKRTLASDIESDWSDAVADVVMDVLGMAFGSAEMCLPAHRTRLSRRREAFAYIERHLDNPDLAVGDIAGELGISVRCLQRLFLEGGLTPRQYLLDRRLDAAARRLRGSTDFGTDSITDIALGVGFNDLSYFTRTFSRKHGASPRDYRRGARGSQPIN